MTALRDQIAAVTGVAGSVGRGIALGLASEEVTVHLMGCKPGSAGVGAGKPSAGPSWSIRPTSRQTRTFRKSTGTACGVLNVFLRRTARRMQAAIHAMQRKAYYLERLVQPEDAGLVVLNALSPPRTTEVTDITIRPLLKPS